jgi:hypothetical protein
LHCRYSALLGRTPAAGRPQSLLLQVTSMTINNTTPEQHRALGRGATGGASAAKGALSVWDAGGIADAEGAAPPPPTPPAAIFARSSRATSA